jgi:hypothetical protein
MTTMGQSPAHNRLMDLERLVDTLTGQLHMLQRESQLTAGWSPAGQLRSNWLRLRRNHLFMSAICTRRIRPNTKEPSHDASRTSR